MKVKCAFAASVVAFVSACAGAWAGEETFGARDDAVGPLGGGPGYTRLVEKGGKVVAREQQLIDVLGNAAPGDVIYVADDAELDFSPWVFAEETVLEVPAGVTVASGRGREGSEGALIKSDAFDTNPLFRLTGAGARITGLRIQGPDPEIRHEPLNRWIVEDGKLGLGRKRYYAFPTSVGIEVTAPDCEIDNCELWGWSLGAVYCRDGGENAHVHHCDIHHNQRSHLGYGVVINMATVLIESNVFDYNRHSIASTGRPGSAYEARNNLVGPHANGHLFDMHGGRDRRDGTDVAGDWMKIHRNTFQNWHYHALVIRGTPQEKVEIHHNEFKAPTIEKCVRPYPAEFLDIGENRFEVKPPKEGEE